MVEIGRNEPRGRSLISWEEVKTAWEAFDSANDGSGDFSQAFVAPAGAGILKAVKWAFTVGAGAEVLRKVLEFDPAKLGEGNQGILQDILKDIFGDSASDSPQPLTTDDFLETENLLDGSFEAESGRYAFLNIGGRVKGEAGRIGGDGVYEAVIDAEDGYRSDTYSRIDSVTVAYRGSEGQPFVRITGLDRDGNDQIENVNFSDIWDSQSFLKGSSDTFNLANESYLRARPPDPFNSDIIIVYPAFPKLLLDVEQRKEDDQFDDIKINPLPNKLIDPYYPDGEDRPDEDTLKFPGGLVLPRERGIDKESTPDFRISPEFDPSRREIRVPDPDRLTGDEPENQPSLRPTPEGLEINIPKLQEKSERELRKKTPHPLVPFPETDTFEEVQTPTGQQTDTCECVQSSSPIEDILDALEDLEGGDSEPVTLNFSISTCVDGSLQSSNFSVEVPSNLQSLAQELIDQQIEAVESLEQFKCGVFPTTEKTRDVVNYDGGEITEEEQALTQADFYEPLLGRIQQILNNTNRIQGGQLSDLREAIRVTVITPPNRGTTYIAEDESSTRFPAGWLQFFRNGETYGSRIDIEFSTQIIPKPTLADDWTLAEINNSELEAELIDWNQSDE